MIVIQVKLINNPSHLYSIRSYRIYITGIIQGKQMLIDKASVM